MAENNSKTFDRALWMMALFAVLTAALAAVAAFRGGEAPAAAAEAPAESGAVTANIELSEWAIAGDLEVLNPDRAGTWVWHCHILTHVENDEGMFGMVTALVVEPENWPQSLLCRSCRL